MLVEFPNKHHVIFYKFIVVLSMFIHAVYMLKLTINSWYYDMNSV